MPRPQPQRLVLGPGPGVLSVADGPGLTEEPSTPTDEVAPTDARRRRVTTEQAAAATFAGFLVVSLVLLLWMGSYRWFFGDEWSFLADRSASLDDLFRAHNQHWSTLPVLYFRAMYSVFGLHSYTPYLVPIVVMHLVGAVLLRVIMRRAGVQPWIATAAAAAYVLLGAAEDNILWGFQVGFASTLALGMGQLMSADHPGPVDRRDWYGLGLGALALITSGQAPPLIIGAGLVCLLHRRWQAAAFHTVPLGCAYVLWYVLSDVPTLVGVDDRPFTAQAYIDWMEDAVVGVFQALGHADVGAVALVVMLVVGLVVAVQSEGLRSLGVRAAVPVAMALTGIIAMSVAAPSRFVGGEGAASAGRYIGVMAALTLPLLAVAADAIARRWRMAAPLVVLLFVLPIPFNAQEFGDDFVSGEFYDRERDRVVALARDPRTAAAPPWVRPNHHLFGQPHMTTGWLLEAEQEGKLPDGEPLDPYAASMIPLFLGVASMSDMDREVVSEQDVTCEEHRAPVAVDPELGDQWIFETGARVALRQGDAPASLWRTYDPGVVEITLPDLALLVAPLVEGDELRLCR